MIPTQRTQSDNPQAAGATEPHAEYDAQDQRAELHLGLPDDALRELALHSIQAQSEDRP